jgi:hypothetical protein
VQRVGLRADRGAERREVVRGVLGLEHGLVRGDPRRELIALGVTEALLVDREVERVDQVGHLVEVVLEGDREVAVVALGAEQLDERELLRGRDVETAPALASSRIRACEVGGLVAAGFASGARNAASRFLAGS